MNRQLNQSNNFFEGVIENIYDPEKLDRVQIRIFGIHSESKTAGKTEGIPTASLPWAWVGKPTLSASVSGKGDNHGLLQGVWVYGISRDGDAYQDLIVLGTIPGKPYESANTSLGFNDPDGVYPLLSRVGESDINRLARGETEDTVVLEKNASREKSVSTGNSGDWDEPGTPFNPIYPHNHVKETESGHIQEYDDTPENERIHTYHKAGSFEEIHPDGTKVVKVVGDGYEIILKDKNILVKGNCNITVLGDASLRVEGDMDSLVKGNLNEVIEGNVTRDVKGNSTETISGSKSSITSGTDVIKGAKVIIN